jgi:glycine/D-amino acid oxidase-like deaminating enzyme
MLTEHRNLRTGTPVWSAHRKPPLHHAALTQDLETDVVVVGAGVSGALLAERLTDEGFHVVVVDRRAPLSGSTSASTALLQHELDVPLVRLTRSRGKKVAERAWRRSRLVVQALAERTKRLGIEAELAPRDTLYLPGTLLDARGLKAEAAARRSIGIEVDVLNARSLRQRYGIRRSAALLGGGNFVAEPRQLAAGYLRVALARGARLFTPVEVTGLVETARGVSLFTRHGQRLRARHVVFATGYELVDGLRATGHTIHSTWVIATRRQQRSLWPTECMVWEASAPYLYLRTTPDGRVLCGGADEPFADATRRDAMSSRKFAQLVRQLRGLFPQLDAQPEYAWAGSFGASDSGLPIIGRLPGRARSFVVLGCGGNGITFAMLAAQSIAGALVDQGDADADLFAPRRK